MTPDAHPEFPLDPALCYLNHAAVAPWPRRTAEAVAGFAHQNLHRGAADYPQWLETEQQLRTLAGRLLGGAAAQDIALLKNTSEGLSLIAQGLPWQAGDNIVSFAAEFPSNRIVWQALADQGVTLRLADHRAADPEAALIGLCDSATRLISVSSVQYADGFRIDLHRLGAFCRQRDILFCVDAIQGLGALPFDAAAVNADFVVADGHKWMLGPEGLALFYTRPEARQRLRLRQYGWRMVEHAGDYDRSDWRPAASARRFECGSPNMLGVHALAASLALLLDTGLEQVAERITSRTEHLIEAIRAAPRLSLITDPDPERRSGIVTFAVADQAPQAVHAELMRHGVICAQRGGGIRLSPHFYTPDSVLDQAMAAITDIVASNTIPTNGEANVRSR